MVKKTSKPLDGEIMGHDEQIDDLEDVGLGRPSHEPTQQKRDMVESLSGSGLPHRNIATLIGVSPPTLRRHYAQELLLGSAKAKAKLTQTAWKMAWGSPAEYDKDGRLVRAEVPPDRTMVIFLCKTQLNWAERFEIDFNGDQTQLVDGMTNNERLQEIESLLKIAESRKPIAPPKPKASSNGSNGSNGSGQVH